MSKVVHFEIHVNDMLRAKKFYADIFGWTYEDYSDYVGSSYFGIIAGDEHEPGINGALMLREGDIPLTNQPPNTFVCTIAVDYYDQTEEKILKSGGKTWKPKTALKGMAWQGYYIDTEGNLFGIHQPDEHAQ